MSSTEPEQKGSLKKRKQKEQQDSSKPEHRKNEQKGAPKKRIEKERQDIRDENKERTQKGGLRDHKEEKQGDATDKHSVNGHKDTKQPKRDMPSPSSICMILVVILCVGVIVGVLWMDANHKKEVANLQNKITTMEKTIKSNTDKLTTKEKEIEVLTTKINDAAKKQQIDDINKRINQLNTEIVNMKSKLK